MPAMTHRERLITALNHEEPDRVPRDLGALPVSGIHVNAYARLIRYLGIDEEPQRALDSYEQRSLMASVSETVLRRFDVDCRELHMGEPERTPPSPVGDRFFQDEWGVTWERPEGGHFINVDGPLQKGEPTLADLEGHRWPDPKDPGRVRGIKQKAVELHEGTDYAVVLNLHDAIIGACQRLRGFGLWLEDLVANPVYAEGLMEHVLAVSTGIAEFVLSEVGEYVDVVMFPEDLGFQDRPFMRPELYRRKLKPRHRRLVDAIKRNTKAKVIVHCDGAIFPLIPDLIDIGVDAINPVQVSAAGMDTRHLKSEFGDHMGFWGGIDTHHVLPSGTPEDVRNEVRTRIADLGPGGGYVLGSVHNIQAEVPPENVEAMFDAAEEFGRY